MGLPGDIRKISGSCSDEGCYAEGCDKIPSWSVQGETDSMGAEYEYFCNDHIDEVRTRIKEAPPLVECCDGCGNVDTLLPSRCWEEGNNGPVYDWCSDCRAKNAESLRQSFSEDELPSEDDFFDPDFDDQGFDDPEVD